MRIIYRLYDNIIDFDHIIDKNRSTIMDSREIELEQRKEQQRAATRERVRKHRAANQVNIAITERPLQSGKERLGKSRLKKKQQHPVVLANIRNENPASSNPITQNTTSMQRTHRYRQRQRERSLYHKPTALSQSKRNRKCYAKKKQLKLSQHIEEEGDGQVGYDSGRLQGE